MASRVHPVHAEVTPTFKDNPQKPEEGVADFVVTIDEGKQFTLRR